jgi:membrane-associated phospholipid phosphatase
MPTTAPTARTLTTTSRTTLSSVGARPRRPTNAELRVNSLHGYRGCAFLGTTGPAAAGPPNDAATRPIRTGALDTITAFWTTAINTLPAVVVALLVELRLSLWRRWRDVVVVVSGLALELSVFLTVNALVDRPRPDVERLGELPHTSSFPSGHVAATIVLYGSVALFVSLSRRRAAVQWLAWSAVVVFAGSVAFSRVYRGMHHPSDVVVGALLGVACLSVAVLATRLWTEPDGQP